MYHSGTPLSFRVFTSSDWIPLPLLTFSIVLKASNGSIPQYACFKAPVYFVPFAPLFMKNYFKAFRMVDKKMNIGFCKTVTRKDVFVWQHDNLVKLLKEAGYDYQGK